MDIDTADAETIAAALADELARDLEYRPVDPHGAARAAARLAEVL